jgi:hypothetical protein
MLVDFNTLPENPEYGSINVIANFRILSFQKLR